MDIVDLPRVPFEQIKPAEVFFYGFHYMKTDKDFVVELATGRLISSEQIKGDVIRIYGKFTLANCGFFRVE